MNKVVRTIEISADLDAAIERLAKDTERTPAEVLTAAVEHFIADIDDISIDLERWAEYERTGVSLSLEEVRERLDKLVRKRGVHHALSRGRAAPTRDDSANLAFARTALVSGFTRRRSPAAQ